MVKIYTRTGDKGNTRTYAGKELAKSHPVIVAGGKIDSLLAELDLVLIELRRCGKTKWVEEVEWVEKKLWQTGGEISLGKPGKSALDCIGPEDVKKLEEWIDVLNVENNFFIRFTKKKAVWVNKARVACREVEVAFVPLLQEGLRPEVFAFTNRLSDYLYALACRLEKEE